MEKSSTHRICEKHVEYNGTILESRETILTIEIHQHSSYGSMKKSEGIF